MLAGLQLLKIELLQLLLLLFRAGEYLGHGGQSSRGGSYYN